MLMTLGGDDDWPLWRAARVAALADSPDAFPDAAGEWSRGGEERWRARLLDESALKVVAVTDGAPVGLARGALEEGAAWLHSLWVAPAERGRGLAHRLVAEVEQWARPRAPYVRLEVVPTNAPARGLYRRLGYVETGARGGCLPDGGREIVMEKPLG